MSELSTKDSEATTKTLEKYKELVDHLVMTAVDPSVADFVNQLKYDIIKDMMQVF